MTMVRIVAMCSRYARRTVRRRTLIDTTAHGQRHERSLVPHRSVKGLVGRGCFARGCVCCLDAKLHSKANEADKEDGLPQGGDDDAPSTARKHDHDADSEEETAEPEAALQPLPRSGGDP